jgi:predicted transcriptional regulator
MSNNPIRLATSRRHIVDYLRDGPMDKRSITDTLNVSRSTADRAVKELLDAGLVQRTDGGYETTLPGVLALQRARLVDTDGDALATTAPMLAPLWKEAPVDIAFLRGADGTMVGDADAVDPTGDLRTAIESATEFRALLPAVPGGVHLDAIQSAAAAGASVRLVCSAALFDRLCRERVGWLQSFVDTDGSTLATASLPGFGLYTMDIGVESVAFLVVYDEGAPHAVLRNATDEGVSWAADCFERVAADARPAAERVRALGVNRTSPRNAPGGPGGRASATEAGPVAKDDALLGAGYAVDGGKLRTPSFGTEGAATVLLWMLPRGFDDGWEMLVKWDYLAIGYRRGLLYGQVYDPDEERERARVTVPVDELDLDRWTHVGYTYDERRARLYIDGECVAELEDDYPLVIDPIGACLGYLYQDRDAGVHEPTYAGQLADTRFYEETLDGETIDRLRRATAPE